MRTSSVVTAVAAVLPLVSPVLGGPLADRADVPAGGLTGGVASSSLADLTQLHKRASCGQGVGSCPGAQCCSSAGYCGTTAQYCQSPQCQNDFSNGKCDADAKPCGVSTQGIPRNNDGNVPYARYITSCTVEGTVAITFDDGPDVYTADLLDLLKSYNVKVTFFITGNNNAKGRIDDPSKPWAALIRRMYAEGHQIASHTWSHQDLTAASPARRTTELLYNEMALRNVLGGLVPKYMRPPFGSCSTDSGCLPRATELGYHVVNWDIDTKDYQNDSPSLIQNSKDMFDAAFAANRGRNIVLSHDTHQQTVQVLAEYMIKKVQAAGLRVVPVGECLGDPRANWYINAPTDPECGGGGSPSDPVSEDGTCGPQSPSNYTCQGSSFGGCCSAYGFCGSTSAYCDGGCQPDFGTCSPWYGGDPIVSQNGLCGESTHQTCAGSTFGNCCSAHGNCGSTDAYCGQGCQASWGTCN